VEPDPPYLDDIRTMIVQGGRGSTRAGDSFPLTHDGQRAVAASVTDAMRFGLVSALAKKGRFDVE
jgi:hypothetical protein